MIKCAATIVTKEANHIPSNDAVQTEEMNSLRLTVMQLGNLNLVYKQHVTDLLKRVSEQAENLADCETLISDLEDENLQMKKQIQALKNQNKHFEEVNQKLMARNNSTGNGYSLSRRISFLAPSNSPPPADNAVDIPADDKNERFTSQQ